MKRALLVVLPVLVLMSFPLSAFADLEDDPQDFYDEPQLYSEDPQPYSEEPQNTNEEYISYDVVSDSGPVDVIVWDAPELAVRMSEPIQLSEPDVSVVYTASSPPPDASDTLTSALVAVLGEYEPRMKTVSVTAVDGTVSEYSEPVEGLAGLDYQWIASFVLFTVVLYCLLRIVGGIFKWS